MLVTFRTWIQLWSRHVPLGVYAIVESAFDSDQLQNKQWETKLTANLLLEPPPGVCKAVSYLSFYICKKIYHAQIKDSRICL